MHLSGGSQKNAAETPSAHSPLFVVGSRWLIVVGHSYPTGPQVAGHSSWLDGGLARGLIIMNCGLAPFSDGILSARSISGATADCSDCLAYIMSDGSARALIGIGMELSIIIRMGA